MKELEELIDLWEEVDSLEVQIQEVEKAIASLLAGLKIKARMIKGPISKDLKQRLPKKRGHICNVCLEIGVKKKKYKPADLMTHEIRFREDEPEYLIKLSTTGICCDCGGVCSVTKIPPERFISPDKVKREA
jgi:hypothetical protein